MKAITEDFNARVGSIEIHNNIETNGENAFNISRYQTSAFYTGKTTETQGMKKHDNIKEE
jgi:hypothetical protein